MSTSPASQPTGKRKRKAQRVVDSDNESDYEQPVKVEASPPPTSPAKQPVKRKAITRAPRKSAAKSSEKVNSQEETQDEKPTVPSPTSTEAADAKGKNKATDAERPTKRQKIPNLRRNASTTATTTPAGSSTPTVEKAPSTSIAAPSRQIVDGPVSTDMDLRDENVFSQLFKKSGTGKSDSRYDLTTTEKMESKKTELAKLREEYITRKAQEKVPPFDLGEQNRKLVDVQRLLERRGSRVCVNVVGSCILTVHKDWIKLAAESAAAAPP